MAIPLKDLLKGAVNRAQIAKPLTGARLIEEANRYLRQILPPARVHDARAISYRNSRLTVACLNGAVANFVGQRTESMLDELKARLPETELSKIQTKIVSEFPERDFVVK